MNKKSNVIPSLFGLFLSKRSDKKWRKKRQGRCWRYSLTFLKLVKINFIISCLDQLKYIESVGLSHLVHNKLSGVKLIYCSGKTIFLLWFCWLKDWITQSQWPCLTRLWSTNDFLYIQCWSIWSQVQCSNSIFIYIDIKHIWNIETTTCK